MLFAFIGKDKPDNLQVRIDNRPAHVEAADKAAAAAILAEDPYAKAGIFGSTEINQWNWTFNKPA